MFKCYLGNIPFTATEADVRTFFAPASPSRVLVCTDRETGKPRGFAFVEFRDANDALAAIERLNGADFGGRKAVVNEAIEKERDVSGKPVARPALADLGRNRVDKPKRRPEDRRRRRDAYDE